MTANAYTVYQDFAPAPAMPFRMDRHYLLYAARGAMRLEAEGRSWSLPPARAALIAAGHEVIVTIPQPLTALSVLFTPDSTPPLKSALTVFEISSLARELLTACREHSDPQATLPPRPMALFTALAQEVWHLAETPSSAHMPAGKSAVVRKALRLTQERLADDPSLDVLAADLAITPRTLARHFASELGMSWRAALRRMRMIRAIEMLAEDGTAVTEVALSCGYSSMSAFSAAFRDMTGQSPAEFRRSFRSAA